MAQLDALDSKGIESPGRPAPPKRRLVIPLVVKPQELRGATCLGAQVNSLVSARNPRIGKSTSPGCVPRVGNSHLCLHGIVASAPS